MSQQQYRKKWRKIYFYKEQQRNVFKLCLFGRTKVGHDERPVLTTCGSKGGNLEITIHVLNLEKLKHF